MDRRHFLRAIPAAATVAALPHSISRAFANNNVAPDKWRTFEVTARVEVMKAKGATRVWLPMPMSEATDYFKAVDSKWTGNMATAEVYKDPEYGSPILFAQFKDGEAAPVVELVSRFMTRDRQVGLAATGNAPAENPAVLKVYLQPTELLPTDGIVKEMSDKIVATAGAKSEVEKARAIYDWVCENTFRDPKTRGCGWGDVKHMIETRSFGGKCGDLNGLFVALSRAAGVPARDVYGIRVADSARGYKSLGKSGDITKAQHCRAEFYAAGLGWVPVDPADVRKVILEERPDLTLNDDVVKRARDMLFGGWEMNWLAYNRGHDIALPGSTGAKIPYAMYPNAETADGRYDSLDPDNFKYRITSKEITA